MTEKPHFNHREGVGSKSEKLASALENAQPILIVTIQTFPYVLDAIADRVSLQQRRYAVIADEAHSSQTGDTAKRLKQVMMIDGKAKEAELSCEDKLNASIAARRHNSNLSYYAFTATPKDNKEEFMSRILERLNDLFVTDNLSDGDMINYAFNVRDKLAENEMVMKQIANNTAEQALLGDFPQAMDDAVLESNEAHQEMMIQYLSNPGLARGFARLVFDLLKGG